MVTWFLPHFHRFCSINSQIFHPVHFLFSARVLLSTRLKPLYQMVFQDVTAWSGVFLNSEVCWSSLLTFFPVARLFLSRTPRIVVSRYRVSHSAITLCLFWWCQDCFLLYWFTGQNVAYWSHLNPLSEPVGTGHQVAPMLRLHLPFPGGWCTAKSWTAPNVFMLPISRGTFPVPWRPSGTALLASPHTSARRPDCWWYYKGERWKSSGGQRGGVVTLPYC